MFSRCCLVLFMCLLYTSFGQKVEDVSSEDDQFTTNVLPLEETHMCSIGNGHVATNVYSDAVYMNGLYNGMKGESHRARIPAWCNIRYTPEKALAGSQRFTLNVKDGVFLAEYDDEEKTVIQRVFAHRFYVRTIINQFFIKSKTNSQAVIKLQQLPGNSSEDIAFEVQDTALREGDVVVHKMCGKTKIVESERYQKETSPVCVYFNDVPETIAGGSDGTTYTFVMAADFKDDVAMNEITDVLHLDPEDLYRNHTNEWHDHNALQKMVVKGNIKLSKTINAMWYYLSSSLPTARSNQPPNDYYGLSPGGLARGSLLEDYQGHNFWDTEIWMFPSILAFYPDYAKQLLDYRFSKLGVAKDIAADFGNKGARFPWESAFTGSDTVEDCCLEIIEFQQHITACIAFAIRQYFSMTQNTSWMKEKGCTLARNIAEFWASRAEWNPDTNTYDINNVMGPDEDHYDINNSVFTNVIAGIALEFGSYASCVCDENAPNEWVRIARQLTIPYDPEFDYNPQFENYTRGTKIKQADVVLLDYPLLYNQNRSTATNNLEYYETVTRENGPAMTWSMHTIGHLRSNNAEQAAVLYTKSYEPYVREPFKIWTEVKDPFVGAVNFMTGMGGFLQTLLFGYGGISIYPDRLEILNPRLPPNTTEYQISDIRYLENSLSLNISQNTSWLAISGERIMIVEQNGAQIASVGKEITTKIQIQPNIKYEISPAPSSGNCLV